MGAMLAGGALVPAANAVTAPVSVIARPGQADAVVAALGRSALRVVRRDGRELQVVTSPQRVDALRALPGVAAAHVAPTSFVDGAPVADGGAVISEGIVRTGAISLRALANGGEGVTIAVLDMGFGATHLPVAQAEGELPPADQTETMSFDPVYGLAGRNAYEHLTNHGELVAQTVYDYAPRAHYIFVNYHTEQDFRAAVDWLVQRRPDIVVHSNSFLEGPFDGTGPAAQAVDRAAAAGIAWFNSAGNYGEKHWEGPWVDADGDRTLDWPTAGWTFTRAVGQVITLAVSWRQAPGVGLSNLDLVVEYLSAGGWVEVAASRDDQGAGARPSERITGFQAPQGGTFRARLVLAAGPPPGAITMFSREFPLTALGDPAPSSTPTPGDSAGAIAIGAVHWSNGQIEPYSSRGPSDDGRMKPDLVAPTCTQVSYATGPAATCGTSIAAPNAAGALALVLAIRRNAAQPLHLAGARDLLASDAVDAGAPGPDFTYGAGAVFLDTSAPVMALEPGTESALATPFAPVPLRVSATVARPWWVRNWSILLDGREVSAGTGPGAPVVNLERAQLSDGDHSLSVRATDFVGTTSELGATARIDLRRPRVRRVTIVRRGPGRVLTADIRDYGVVRVDLMLRRGGKRYSRHATVTAAGPTRMPLGVVPDGSYRMAMRTTDRAGNATTITRTLSLRR